MNIGETPIRGRHDDLTQQVIGIFFDVYNELGPGFVESVYREAMRLALTQARLIVNGVVLIELKTCEALSREHEAQTLNYLKATEIEVALLMNFGPVARFKCYTMDNTRKRFVPKSVQIAVKPLAETEVAR